MMSGLMLFGQWEIRTKFKMQKYGNMVAYSLIFIAECYKSGLCQSLRKFIWSIIIDNS